MIIIKIDEQSKDTKFVTPGEYFYNGKTYFFDIVDDKSDIWVDWLSLPPKFKLVESEIIEDYKQLNDKNRELS